MVEQLCHVVDWRPWSKTCAIGEAGKAGGSWGRLGEAGRTQIHVVFFWRVVFLVCKRENVGLYKYAALSATAFLFFTLCLQTVSLFRFFWLWIAGASIGIIEICIWIALVFFSAWYFWDAKERARSRPAATKQTLLRCPGSFFDETRNLYPQPMDRFSFF